MAKIRVLIVDDHRLFRRGLRHICETLGGFEVAGEAGDGEEAVRLACELCPDVALVDISMPVMDGIQATSHIMEKCPAVKVIVLTMYRQDRFIYDAIKAGAQAYLLKDVDENVLVETVQSVARGDVRADAALATWLIDEFRNLNQPENEGGGLEELSPREMSVLVLVAQGLDNKTIARRLSISDRTVANRLNDIFQKLHLNNRTQAALLALRRGWANLEDGQ
ncbi:MAG: response regulator transcription factor [Anaerolineales bacterium]|nr:response regulator transcription factor [Anaerolineales bacterium]